MGAGETTSAFDSYSSEPQVHRASSFRHVTGILHGHIFKEKLSLNDLKL